MLGAYMFTCLCLLEYWHKNRHIDHRNRIQNLEINPSLYSQLIFNKEGRTIKWRKIASSTNGVGRSGQLHAEKIKLNHQLIPYTKINSGWIKDLNISCETIKILEENIGRKISDILHSNIFTNMSPRARDIKERINKWDYIKLKGFCMTKEINIKMKREPTIWENIFANDTSDKGLISKIYKEFTWLHFRKINKPIKKWAKDLNRHFSKEDIQRALDTWKIAQHH